MGSRIRKSRSISATTTTGIKSMLKANNVNAGSGWSSSTRPWCTPAAGYAQKGAPIPPPGGCGGKGKGGGRGKARPPSRPTPHWPDGRVNLGPLPGEKGVWEGNAGATLATNINGGLDNPAMNLPTNLKISEVPFQPWARAIYDYRQATTTQRRSARALQAFRWTSHVSTPRTDSR